MLWLGIDDTDTLDSPGTNKLALHLTRVLADRCAARLVVRHQLFFDPRVPYTSHNGCASLLLEPHAGCTVQTLDVEALADFIRPIIKEWSPVGSDPGLCIARSVPDEIIEFGQRCQRDVVTQAEAFALADRCGLHLESIAGSGDGAIGALAAVGLLATRNDGRVLHQGYGEGEPFDVQGSLTVAEIIKRGVTRLEHVETGERVERGTVELSKRLRPNLRHGELILFVKPAEGSTAEGSTVEEGAWQAVKVV